MSSISDNYDSKAKPFLLNITLGDIAAGLDQGRFKCVDLVEAYLARTAEINSEFRPIIQTNPGAVLVARDLDAEIESKGRRGCVCRFPIAAKKVSADLTSGRCTESQSMSKTILQHMTSSMVLLAL